MSELEAAIDEYVRACGRRRDSPTVGELADRVGMGVRTLRRRCREELGCTPKQALRLMQLTLADELLTTTDLSTAEIASRCGFGSSTTLFRTFRAMRGTTPRGSDGD